MSDMDQSSPSAVVDPASLYYADAYPSPSSMPSDTVSTPASQSDQPKKKRKAWGQPVPEIVQILPPRKRAKTAEEKEQRKNERILRNRRAADKSRQRQKAAVAQLEQNQKQFEVENTKLREILAQFQSRFGTPDDLQSALASLEEIKDECYLEEPSPMNLDHSVRGDTPATTISYHTSVSEQPVLVQNDTTTPIKHESPALAPTLNLIENCNESGSLSQDMDSFTGLGSTSVLTQYPAAVLCDLQCQTQVGTSSPYTSRCSCQPTFRLGLSQLLQTIQYLMIFQTFSNTTLLPMYQLFQMLGQKLATASMEQTFPSILNSFPLIHSLISMPSTPTRPAVFRMKLLSRLLACSPHMARLLLAATDRALQRVVSDDGFVEDTDQRWTWSSLMTIKWTILRLEREHRKIRQQVALGGATDKDIDIDLRKRQNFQHDKLMAGVDLGAVARSTKLWYETRTNCNNIMDESWVLSVPEVH